MPPFLFLLFPPKNSIDYKLSEFFYFIEFIVGSFHVEFYLVITP